MYPIPDVARIKKADGVFDGIAVFVVEHASEETAWLLGWRK
jgi:hypothetical protein